MRVGLHLGTVALFVALTTPGSVRAQGLLLPGGGAAHLSMGGASSATPVDAIGALYWNPAAIGRGTRLDEQTPGSGLGLSIAAALAQSYGGALSLRAAEPRGLVAVLVLPGAYSLP